MSKPDWISHRGLDERSTENTRDAFEAARDVGFTHLETDLRSTRDGHLILHHDPSLERTAGYSANVENLTMAEADQVRLQDGQKILTFDDFADRFGDARWILDIKPENGERTLRQLYEWAKRHNKLSWLTNNARFLLWDPRHIRLLRELFPGAEALADQRECRRAGLSILMGIPGIGRIIADRTYSLPPNFLGRNLFSPKITQHYHRKGARFLAYLPEKQRDLEKAVESGADEILINGRPLDNGR